MNRRQRRAFAAKMRTCKDPHEALIAARLRGWIPDGKKAITFAYQKVRQPPVQERKLIRKQGRDLATALGIGPGQVERRPSQQERNKKKQARRALRRAGWVLG